MKKYERVPAGRDDRARDLNRVIQWMTQRAAPSAITASPMPATSRLHERKPIPGGLLGADYEVDERPLPLQDGLRRA